MVKHSVRTWVKFGGSWDVTHDKDGELYGRGHPTTLFNRGKDYRNFPSRKEAEDYAIELFNRLCRKGNWVALESPDTFGQEVAGGFNWILYEGYRWYWVYEDGKVERGGEPQK